MVINTHLIIKVCLIVEYLLKIRKFSLEIDDFNVIVEVIHLCGGKHRLIPSPFANDKKKLLVNVPKFVRTYVLSSLA